MSIKLAAVGGLVVVGAIGVGARAAASAPERGSTEPRAVEVATPAPGATEVAVFSGGCFWGIQLVYQHVKGVVNAESGYVGGSAETASYDQIGSGTTGHAESVRVTYDPARVSYAQLLAVFFSVAHDPTQLNRQGADVGTQYRSAIWYTSPEQQRAAAAYIDRLGEAKAFSRPIVTEVAPLAAFYLAEAYHQDYAAKHPYSPYIVMHDAPKVRELERKHPELYSDARVAYVAAR
jgi:peptide-methionine (S)-S-oxide reductase